MKFVCLSFTLLLAPYSEKKEGKGKVRFDAKSSNLSVCRSSPRIGERKKRKKKIVVGGTT